MQIEAIAGLAVFPLVALMTVTAALRVNLAELANSKESINLPCLVTSMHDFKDLIGFHDVELIQQKFLAGKNLKD